MNLNASIIDQHLTGVQQEIRERVAEELNVTDRGKLKSLAFVYLCVRRLLDLDPDEAFDCLTDGGGDFGVDALHLTEEIDGEFCVTLFQAKYHRKLEGQSEFELSGINAMINAIRHIFNPLADLGNINDRLRVRVETARSLIQDGFLPRIRAVACNNGLRWNEVGQTAIERAAFGSQVSWEHLNHDQLIGIMQRVQPVSARLRLIGKAIVEDMNYSRVCIGRILVTEIAVLMQEHGDRLLESNIRRYPGLHGNRVNEGIRKTLLSDESENFYFFNNGLTLICDSFSYNALQSSDYLVRAENLRIVHGSQICTTIADTLSKLPNIPDERLRHASVLVRICELPSAREETIRQITQNASWLSPGALRDLHSNDHIQLRLQQELDALGYSYRRQRHDSMPGPFDVTSREAATAILAVCRRLPHRAADFSGAFFGTLYSLIFKPSLNGAELVTAVLLFRLAKKHHSHPIPNAPALSHYAPAFIAMQMGEKLQKQLQTSINHHSFTAARQLIHTHGESWYDQAIEELHTALIQHYGPRPLTQQQLATTFRRSDLLPLLTAISN